MAIYESWDPIAIRLGYKTEGDMLVDLYVNQQLSIAQMVKKLGYAQNSIRTRLMENNVTLRARGGPNSTGKTILSKLTDEQVAALKPADLLNVENLDPLCTKPYICTPNTLYKEKIRRGLVKPKEKPECTTPVSPQPPTSINTLEEDTSNSASPMLPSETPLTSSGIENEEKPETSSSSTTEPTRENLSPSTNSVE